MSDIHFAQHRRAVAVARRGRVGSCHGRAPRRRDLVGLHLTVLPRGRAHGRMARAPVRRRDHLVALLPPPGVPAGRDPARASSTPSTAVTHTGSGWRRCSPRAACRTSCTPRSSRTPRRRSASASSRATAACTAPSTTAIMEALWAEGVDVEPARDRSAGSRSRPGSTAARSTRCSRPARTRDRVEESTRQAIQIGANAVPAFLLGRRLLVLGAQPEEVLEQALAQIGFEPDRRLTP